MLLTVAEVTALNEVLELAGTEATGGVGKLEGPEEVGGLLEVGANGVDLVNEILHADDAVLAEVLLDDRVVGEGNALLVDLAVSALVDKLLDGLEVGVTVGNPGLDDLDHLSGGLGNADEDTVVDLEKTEELEDLAGLGGDLVDTLDADQEDELGLSGDVERAILLGGALEADLLALNVAVLLDVGLGALEDDSTLLLVGLLIEVSNEFRKIQASSNSPLLRCNVRPERWYLATASANLVAMVCCASCCPLNEGSSSDGYTHSLLLLDLGLALSAGLLLRLALLQEGLGDQDIVLGGDGTKHLRLVRVQHTRGMW